MLSAANGSAVIVQMDMNLLAVVFDISHIGEDGEKHQPVMLHRALFGSIERFLGILIENHAANCRCGSLRNKLWFARLSATLTVMPKKLQINCV